MDHTCTACRRRGTDPVLICRTCWDSGVRTRDGAATHQNGPQVKRWKDLSAGDLVQITCDRVATVAAARQDNERAYITFNEAGGGISTLTNTGTARIRVAAPATAVMGLKVTTSYVQPGTWGVGIGGLYDEFTAGTLADAVWQAAAVVALRTGWPTTEIRVGQITGSDFVATISSPTT